MEVAVWCRWMLSCKSYARTTSNIDTAIQEKARQQEQQNLGPWKQQNASTEQVQHCSTSFRETVRHHASAAELGPMKQRHTGMGTMNIRNGTGNKKRSESGYK
ncbi:hypothetical protein ARMSODRAFT_974339 [Armillaria solidipes]|uniref:Uncharacterized protein n=1 Tax=Armillaria solidipes TaxID=1076256 RepID=A0A2H3BWE8_9AGAR|nr:hypothetical protein ARMSODRAFT_974339 [Armillaria solidipes]